MWIFGESRRVVAGLDNIAQGGRPLQPGGQAGTG